MCGDDEVSLCRRGRWRFHWKNYRRSYLVNAFQRTSRNLFLKLHPEEVNYTPETDESTCCVVRMMRIVSYAVCRVFIRSIVKIEVSPEVCQHE